LDLFSKVFSCPGSGVMYLIELFIFQFRGLFLTKDCISLEPKCEREYVRTGTFSQDRQRRDY
jgi:hypothetical protein